MLSDQWKAREFFFLVPQNTNNDKTGQLHKSKGIKSGKEAQKETTRLIIYIGLPQSKNKVHSNSEARIESKIQWVDKI